VRVAGWRFMARIDGLDAQGGRSLRASLFTCESEGSHFLAQVENFFRLVVAYRLLELGGVLLHSAGLAWKGRALVFVGHSGAGKTTLSRLGLAAGHTVLSDDMNALCPDDSRRLMAEKLPFAGDLGRVPSPRQAFPLAAVCRLRKGENRRRRIRPAEAVAFLVGSAPFVNVDPHRSDRLTNNLENLVRTVPVDELSFSREGGFWHLLDDPIPGTPS
jgi:hypothetical protein